jgi:hypothetical protein
MKIEITLRDRKRDSNAYYDKECTQNDTLANVYRDAMEWMRYAPNLAPIQSVVDITLNSGSQTSKKISPNVDLSTISLEGIRSVYILYDSIPTYGIVCPGILYTKRYDADDEEHEFIGKKEDLWISLFHWIYENRPFSYPIQERNYNDLSDIFRHFIRRATTSVFSGHGEFKNRYLHLRKWLVQAMRAPSIEHFPAIDDSQELTWDVLSLLVRGTNQLDRQFLIPHPKTLTNLFNDPHIRFDPFIPPIDKAKTLADVNYGSLTQSDGSPIVGDDISALEYVKVDPYFEEVVHPIFRTPKGYDDEVEKRLIVPKDRGFGIHFDISVYYERVYRWFAEDIPFSAEINEVGLYELVHLAYQQSLRLTVHDARGPGWNVPRTPKDIADRFLKEIIPWYNKERALFTGSPRMVVFNLKTTKSAKSKPTTTTTTPTPTPTAAAVTEDASSKKQKSIVTVVIDGIQYQGNFTDETTLGEIRRASVTTVFF